MKPLAGLALKLLRAGRGLVLPLFLLAVATAGLLNRESSPLAGLRDAQFDRYQRLMPRLREDEPVVVVGIDSKSLQEYGQWPWPRDLFARLIDRIASAEPLAIGVDVIFAEPDRYSPGALAERLPGMSPSTLAALPDPDQALADSISRVPTALGIIGLTSALPGAKAPTRPVPRITAGKDLEPALPAYVSAVVSRPVLARAAAGEGVINANPGRLIDPNERGVLRQVPTLSMVASQPFLSLPLEMVRIALPEGAAVTVDRNNHGLSAIHVGDYHLPTAPSGELIVHFGRASSNYHLSASDVLAGKHGPEVFQSRFVIVGFNSTGLQDRVVTPLGESLPGADIHAQVIESLLTGSALRRPGWLPSLEVATLLAGGALLIVFMPLLRPRRAILLFAGLALTLVAGGYLAFYLGRWLFDGVTTSVLLTPIFIALLGKTLIESDQQRRNAEHLLQASREEAARLDGELSAARQIQMGLLPDLDQLFADQDEFAVAAVLEPARAVGGDYYDCFMLTPRRLCIAIGDVSGKGIPASLFMAISKTLSSSLIRRQPDLGAAIRDVEIELNRENPTVLFVTAFVGVLDLDSGELEFVCAGHDAPILLRDGQTSRIDTAPSSGPPLCAVGDYPFVADRVGLLPGDLLCLYTDGITEASNGTEMFGHERLQESIRQSGNAFPSRTVNALRDTIRAFEAGLPPSDDLTVLALTYRGTQPGSTPNQAI